MLMAVLIALVLIAGPHPAAAGLVALAYLSPEGLLAAAVVWAAVHARRRARERRARPGAEAQFLRGVAAEVEAGASVREAVLAAADRSPELGLDTAVRLAAAGRPASDVAEQLGAALAHNGRVAAAAYRMVAETGARAGPVFSGLAVRAAHLGELERTRRVLTTQARLSAWVVGGLPIVVTGLLMVTGRGPVLEGPSGVITVVGALLIVVGAVVVWLMVRGS